MKATKDFKYTVKTKSGKDLIEVVVTFGSEEKPFPQDWQTNPYIQMLIQEYKGKILEENFNVTVDEY